MYTKLHTHLHQATYLFFKQVSNVNGANQVRKKLELCEEEEEGWVGMLEILTSRMSQMMSSIQCKKKMSSYMFQFTSNDA